ncbi:antibiotic biosynthesis monooxygenase [Mucilaginibacter puniceus]
MILEAAILNIIAGKQKQFEIDFDTAGQYISSIKGYIKHSLNKCLEQENKYLLLVEWDSLKDHTIIFRQSEQYKHWKQLLHHYYAPFPIVEHYEKII